MEPVCRTNYNDCYKAPFFDCSSKENTFSRNSYLKSGHTKRLLNGTLCENEQIVSTTFFGISFLSENAFIKNHIKVFNLCKKNFQKLENAVRPNIYIRDSDANDLYRTRLEICNFFAYLKVYVSRLSNRFDATKQNAQSTKFLLEIVKNVKELAVFFGRLSDIPSFVFANGIFSKNNACHQYYHACLDFWWSAIEFFYLLHNLCLKMKLDINLLILPTPPIGSTIFHGVSTLVLWDLCYIASKHYRSGQSSSTIVCSCLDEFWVLLIHILNTTDTLEQKNVLWQELLRLFVQVEKQNESTQNTSENDLSKDTFVLQAFSVPAEFYHEFCLWLTNHISNLHKYDINGENIGYQTPGDCNMISKHVIKSLMNSEGTDKKEKSFRSSFYQLLQIANTSKPCGEIVLILTDFFIKNIDNTFYILGVEILGLSYIFKTSSAWLEHLRILTSESNASFCQLTSFNIYLRILCSELKNYGEHSSLWRQVKGRIFCKFTTKRITELSEAGLQNCFTVFLCIASVTEIEQLPSKICEFIDAILKLPDNIKKKMIAWKAAFVLMLLLQQKEKCLESLAITLVTNFDTSCREYKGLSEDSMIQCELMTLLLVYVDNVTEAFENSCNLSQGEHILISAGYSTLLSSCNSELTYLLSNILKMLLKLHSVAEKVDTVFNRTQCKLVLCHFFTHVHPFVEKHVLTDTPPSQLADIAVAFTHMSVIFSSEDKAIVKSPVDLFTYFGCNAKINSAVMCRYLCFSIKEDNLMQHLQVFVPNLSTMFIQSWLKCCVSMLPPCVQLQELSKSVIQQKDVLERFPNLKILAFSNEELHNVFCIRFFQVLGESYEKCESLERKYLMQNTVQTYFRSFYSEMESTIRSNCRSSQMLSHVYYMAGHLIRHCAPMLHLPHGNNGVFASVIDLLLFPHITFRTEKHLLQVVAPHIKNSLHLFLQGILKMQYKTDLYIKRRLKEVVINLSFSNYPATNNPITNACVDSKDKTENLELCVAVLDIVRAQRFNYIGNTAQSCAVQCCLDIFKKVSVPAKHSLYADLLIDAKILHLEGQGILLNHAKDLLKVVFSFIKLNLEQQKQRDVILSLCKDVAIQIESSQLKCFRLLEEITENFPEIMCEFIPSLTKHVEDIECKRASGFDANLRNEFRKIVEAINKAMRNYNRK